MLTATLKVEVYGDGTRDGSHCTLVDHVVDESGDEARALVLACIDDVDNPTVEKVFAVGNDSFYETAFRDLVAHVANDPARNQRQWTILGHTRFNGPDGEEWGDAGLGSWDVPSQRWDDYHFWNPRTNRWENEAGCDVPQDQKLWGGPEDTVER